MKKRQLLNKLLNRPEQESIPKSELKPDQTMEQETGGPLQENSPNGNNMEQILQAILNRQDPSDSRRNIRFDDIESSFKKFNGETDVITWINHFLEQSTIFKLNSFEKFVYSKKLMTGVAALFTRYESEATTFEEFALELKQEYSRKQNSALTHSKLKQRKKKPDETPIEYLYEMMNIASGSNVDTQAIITYTIEGLPGTSQSKSHMFEADNLKEFKRKLAAYETEQQTLGIETKKPSKDETRKHCYNCGEIHPTSECPDRSKGTKCFRCNQFGHISRSCTATEPTRPRIGLVRITQEDENEEELST